ncbi:unnamed protein product [Arabidopsis lyrata]|nr:unnamed protein product [Arabidopsis lyrata]
MEDDTVIRSDALDSFSYAAVFDGHAGSSSVKFLRYLVLLLMGVEARRLPRHRGVEIRRPQEAIELYLEAAPENFRREIAAEEKEVGRELKCLLTNVFSSFAADMATVMNALWVAFWTAGANSLTAHLYTDLIRETIDVKGDVVLKDSKLKAEALNSLKVPVAVKSGFCWNHHFEADLYDIFGGRIVDLYDISGGRIVDLYGISKTKNQNPKTRN